jgi:ribonuclease BN (tRNA processing enzyme)
MRVKLTVVGCSPAWPNPGGAQSGYLLEGSGRLLLDCGPGVLPRLRETEAWPRLDAIAITHFHLDHWGDLVPWVWGSMYGPGKANGDRPELWLPPGGTKELEHFGNHFGRPQMFEDAFEIHEYEDRTPFWAAGFEVTPTHVLHYELQTYGFRVMNDRKTLAYSGDSGPCEELVEVARDADLFLCEATLLRGELEGDLRGHLDVEEAVDAFRRSGARRLLITHRPRELPLEGGLEQAADGLEIDV